MVGAVPDAPDLSAPATLPALLCAACRRDLPVTAVAMTLYGAAGLDRPVAVTDRLAADAEELQFQLGEGPGLDAVRQEKPLLCEDLAGSGQQWPAFAAAAVEPGVAAVFAFPLRMHGIRLGVLTLYRDAPGRLDDDALAEAIAYSQAATAVLLHLQALARPVSDLHPQLTGVLADRAAVHQATGMIAAQADVTPADALMLLRARAYSTGETLSSVCRDVLERRLMFGSGFHASVDTDSGRGRCDGRPTRLTPGEGA